jgi:histidinol phosphatase-like PHP family hydrolase
MNDIEQKYKELRAIAEKMGEHLEIIKKTGFILEIKENAKEALKSFEAFKAKEGE